MALGRWRTPRRRWRSPCSASMLPRGRSRSTMIQAPTVLIVHDDLTVLARLSARLKGRAEVSTATTFDEAKAILSATPPTVLITGVRLGPYNGLHLIIRSRIDHPTTVGIVIAER